MAAMLARRPSRIAQYRSGDRSGRPSARLLRLREAAVEWLARVCDGGAFSLAARAGAWPFPLRSLFRFPIPLPRGPSPGGERNEADLRVRYRVVSLQRLF